MGILRHLFWEAKPEEEASFCDTDNREHVQNMNAADAEIAKRTARDIDEADVKEWFWPSSTDDRVNRLIYEKGTDSNPDDPMEQAKYRPGR